MMVTYYYQPIFKIFVLLLLFMNAFKILYGSYKTKITLIIIIALLRLCTLRTKFCLIYPKLTIIITSLIFFLII